LHETLGGFLEISAALAATGRDRYPGPSQWGL